MKHVFHCGAKRHCKTYYLFSQTPGMLYDVLQVLERCRGCGGCCLELSHITMEQTQTRPQRLKQREHSPWMARMRENLAFEKQPWQNSRQALTVGDWTRFISQDTAKIFQQVLAREVLNEKWQARDDRP